MARALVFIITLLCATHAHAQAQWSNFMDTTIDDTKTLVTSPARWERSDFNTALAIVAATGAIMAVDDEIQETIQHNRSSTLTSISSVTREFGNISLVVPALVGTYAIADSKGDERLKHTALLAIESNVVSGVLFVMTLKKLGGRHRPRDHYPSDTWEGPIQNDSHYSFPSGHATVAFSTAAVVSEHYGHVPYVTPISYGLATVTSLSRMYDNKHWASDVFFGAALGYFTAKAIMRYHNAAHESAWQLSPVLSPEVSGLNISYAY